MKTWLSKIISLTFTALFLINIPLAAQDKITSPEEFFGFKMGADFKLARWDKIVEDRKSVV